MTWAMIALRTSMCVAFAVGSGMLVGGLAGVWLEPGANRLLHLLWHPVRYWRLRRLARTAPTVVALLLRDAGWSTLMGSWWPARADMPYRNGTNACWVRLSWHGADLEEAWKLHLRYQADLRTVK